MNTEIILSTQTHPGDSTLNIVTSEKFKGDGYYGRSDGLHTIQVSLNGFIGKIKIEACLNVNPNEEDWFTVILEDLSTVSNTTILDYIENETSSKLYNCKGNFVFLRAKVYDWTDGTINNIRLNL